MIKEPKEKVAFYCRRRIVEFFRGYSNSNMSAHFNKAIEVYMDFKFTVYIIKNDVAKMAYIGIYSGFETHDIYWHYVNTPGSGTIGDAVRRTEFGLFSFEIVGKFEKLSYAHFFRKTLMKKLEDKYTFYRDLE